MSSNEQKDRQTSDPQEHPVLSRRRFLGMAGGVIAGLSLTEPVYADEPLSVLRAKQQLEALNEFNLLQAEPIHYTQFRKENLPTITPLVQAMQRLTMQMRQILGNNQDLTHARLDQLLVAKTFAQQEFLTSIISIVGKQQLSGNIDLDMQRIVLRKVLPYLAEQGVYARVDLYTVPAANPTTGKQETAALMLVFDGLWTIDSVRERSVANIWDESEVHFQEIFPKEALRDRTGKALFPYEDIKQCMPEAETVHDAVVWQASAIDTQPIEIQVREWQAKQANGFWEKVQSFGLAQCDQMRKSGQLPPDLVIHLLADQCRSVYVPKLLSAHDSVQVFAAAAENRTRMHEASHIHLGRLPGFTAAYPVMHLQSIDIEYQQKQVLLSSIRTELGAILGETVYGPSMPEQIESLCIFISKEKELPSYATASKWILQQIATILSNDPSRFGITIDRSLALTPTEQALLQSPVWMQPENAQELRNAMKPLIEYYLTTDIETLLDQKAPIPSQKTPGLPLGKIGAGIAIAAAGAGLLKKWHQNKSRDRLEQEQRRADQQKKRIDKKHKK